MKTSPLLYGLIWLCLAPLALQADEQLDAISQMAIEADQAAQKAAAEKADAKRKAAAAEQAEATRKANAKLAKAKEKCTDQAGVWKKGRCILPTPAPATPASVPAPRPPVQSAIEPQMVSIPAGSFTMGCKLGRDDIEGVCLDDETPPHVVNLPAFQIGKYEVTFDEWDACERAKVCHHAYDDGWGRGKRPVLYVSWNDITQKYLPWLNQQTGKRYRLPTDAEWEYAARAGGESAYPWGNTINCQQARYRGLSDGCKAADKTLTVGSYPANAWGLHDTVGNVYEWVQDWGGGNYYHSSPVSAPQGPSSGTSRVLRGGSWFHDAKFVRSAHRYDSAPRLSSPDIGFRLAQDQ
ncbi:MAG: formylglycine-generating enzyme family protein [Thiolinea sp.]